MLGHCLTNPVQLMGLFVYLLHVFLFSQFRRNFNVAYECFEILIVVVTNVEERVSTQVSLRRVADAELMKHV